MSFLASLLRAGECREQSRASSPRRLGERAEGITRTSGVVRQLRVELPADGFGDIFEFVLKVLKVLRGARHRERGRANPAAPVGGAEVLPRWKAEAGMRGSLTPWSSLAGTIPPAGELKRAKNEIHAVECATRTVGCSVAGGGRWRCGGNCRAQSSGFTQ